MIISRTPLRISFFGGGTDLPEFFMKSGRGAVLGTAVDKHIFHSVMPFHSHLFDYSIRISYRKVECVNGVDEIEHAPFRECLKYVGIDRDIEIDLTAELPSFSGMGSSSSFTVGLLNALLAYRGRTVPRMELAYMAIEIEREILKEAVGCQDQVFAAIGGMNVVEFITPRNIVAHSIPLSAQRREELESSFMLFYTGMKRRAASVEAKKINNIDAISGTLKKMLEQVDEGYRILTGTGPLSDFGMLLDNAWRHKRSLEESVSNDAIDKIYDTAVRAGALGGKVVGAGGGGFILFFVPPEKQDNVRKALGDFHQIGFAMNAPGSSIIYS
ncbi:MAG: GHMP kinase [Deltaproteobacteria bacterium]|nr:GHMP kinase [Deltaproteobacteria bacterium]